jgi:hypothetical protein
VAGTIDQVADELTEQLIEPAGTLNAQTRREP